MDRRQASRRPTGETQEAQAVMGVLFIHDNYNGLQSSSRPRPEGWEVPRCTFPVLQGRGGFSP